MYKFRAKTHVGLSVATKGGNAHITFTELTGGGSTFNTDDKELATALRKHHKFGKLFKEVPDEEPVMQAMKEQKTDAAQKAREKASVREFGCVDDAKEYMADTFGISRSKLRTRADIEKQAIMRGLTIQWSDKKPAADASEVVADGNDNAEEHVDEAGEAEDEDTDAAENDDADGDDDADDAE